MFNEQYKKEECYWGKEPDKGVKLILKYKKSGDVLDLGCGEGRNALFLAKNGFDVTGVDISEEGIKKFKTIAENNGLNVRSFVKDIKNFNFDKKYDVIISNATLHFLKENEIKKIIKKVKENTKKDGLNVINVFTEENPNKNFPYLFKNGELKSHYSDWEILGYKEGISEIQKHGKLGKPHRHGFSVIIARKH
ncbi:MAG: methyltransferase domain-containing protein [Nanoarchaeota archaeon]|nr:methyltransferase domain-containing protein [Nanoarchaeota archaeon]